MAEDLVKLDEFFEQLLICPFCKGELRRGKENYECCGCPLTFSCDGPVRDFRIHYPDFLVPAEAKEWKEIQLKYENFSKDNFSCFQIDDHKEHLSSVEEIYDEFRLNGTVLDVGGQYGTLRRYLGPQDHYLSIDPFKNIFSFLSGNEEIIKLHPVLREPCNFICCLAEYLPLRSEKFDIVHMRSVLDHFLDPFLAVLESYRVLQIGGRCIIGLSVTGGKSSIRTGAQGVVDRIVRKLKNEGPTALFRAVAVRLYTIGTGTFQKEHTRNWQYEDVISILSTCHFTVNKTIWQKPPFDHCVYIEAVKTS